MLAAPCTSSASNSYSAREGPGPPIPPGEIAALQANKMVLCTAPFRLSSVIEAAMEIAGPGAAMKRLQVGSSLVWYHLLCTGPHPLILQCSAWVLLGSTVRLAVPRLLLSQSSGMPLVVPDLIHRWHTTLPRTCPQ